MPHSTTPALATLGAGAAAAITGTPIWVTILVASIAALAVITVAAFTTFCLPRINAAIDRDRESRLQARETEKTRSLLKAEMRQNHRSARRICSDKRELVSMKMNSWIKLPKFVREVRAVIAVATNSPSFNPLTSNPLEVEAPQSYRRLSNKHYEKFGNDLSVLESGHAEAVVEFYDQLASFEERLHFIERGMAPVKVIFAALDSMDSQVFRMGELVSIMDGHRAELHNEHGTIIIG